MLNDNLSLSDIAAVTNGGGGIGGNNGWWVLIILFALFGGWGNGYGGGFGGGQVGDNYVLASDMSQLSRAIADSAAMTERKLDGVNNGLCSGFYQEAQLVGNLSTNMMAGFNTTQAAIKDCCCQTQQNISDVKYTIGATGTDISRGVERGFADTNYNIATQANGITNAISNGFCQTNFNAQTNTRDIVDSQNAGTQAILARLDAMENSRLREKLEAERDARYALQGQLDRAQLRTDIVNDVRPCPKPAYITCNPFGCNCGNSYNAGYFNGTTIA